MKLSVHSVHIKLDAEMATVRKEKRRKRKANGGPERTSYCFHTFTAFGQGDLAVPERYRTSTLRYLNICRRSASNHFSLHQSLGSKRNPSPEGIRKRTAILWALWKYREQDAANGSRSNLERKKIGRSCLQNLALKKTSGS